MRITHQQKDYSFQLLTSPVHAATTEIEVQAGDILYTLIRKGYSWVPKDKEDELAEAIGKVIALRYRI